MGTPPGAVGVAPRQLGLELAPGRGPAPTFGLESPPGSVIEPAQRGMTLTPATGRLNLTRQLLEQIRLRNGELPGSLEP